MQLEFTEAIDRAIPAGVTLVSGRGRDGSQGALIYSEALTENDKATGTGTPLFKTAGKGVRVTGLRIRGPFAEVGDHHCEVRQTITIGDRLEPKASPP